ncbi:MAG: hypothetical protein E7Z80_05980 [Methanobrevibacter thaueri]|nr:hypothetical protein [Methanobrevibacter thaueri]
MGSSKGKDILFFGLLGLFLILSQLIDREINVTKFLKISIVVGCVLLVSGILLEVLFRLNMGIKLNTIFVSMSNGMSSTSILHTHLLKSILGHAITQIMGPFIGNNINTGVGLYTYVPSFAFLVILLIPILFITLTLALQKRPWPTTIITAFASSCLLIGIIDGGLFATPSYVGIFGLYLIYREGYYINKIIGKLLNDEKLLENNEKIQSPYRNKVFGKRLIFNHCLVYIAIIGIIMLRFTIAFAGAEPDYYTIEIADMKDNVDFGNLTITQINNTTYHANSTYNEMELLNKINIPLTNSCKYYTVTWNIYSYFN